MAIEKELLDNLFTNYNYQKPEDLLGENGLLKQLCWFNGNWSFSAFELTYSNGEKLHEKKT